MTVQGNEKALILRVAAGDRAAFKCLYDDYWDDLYALALSFLKSPDWAQDMVQDVFLKLWIRREEIPAIGQFRAYIFTMLRNGIVSALRQRRLREKYQRQLPGDFLAPEAETRLATRELEELVREAIARLPHPQGLLIALTREQGLSHEEIAQRLGMAKKTVSNSLTKALNSIRLYLRARGV